MDATINNFALITSNGCEYFDSVDTLPEQYRASAQDLLNCAAMSSVKFLDGANLIKVHYPVATGICN